MCELFGFSSEKPTDIKALLTEFFSHSAKHPHGWGLMHDGKTIKGCERAIESSALSEILETGANDVYVIRKNDGSEELVPDVPQFIRQIDIDNHFIKIDFPEWI